MLVGLIRDWILGAKTVAVDGFECDQVTAELYLHQLAQENVATIIGNALVQSNINTYKNGKMIRENMYHLFNVKPNINENAADFRKKLASKLVFNNDALIIQSQNGELFIADSFEENDSVFFPKIYSDITFGDFKMSGTRNATQVLHIKLNNNEVNKVLDQVNFLFAKAVRRSMSQFYKLRGLFKLNNFVGYDNASQEDTTEIFRKKVASYFGDANASVMTLEKGLEFEDKSKNDAKVEDIDAMIDKIFGFVFNAYGVPISLMKEVASSTAAKTTSASMDQLLSQCIDPLAKTIETEVNAKFYTIQDYKNKTYVRIKTHNVKHTSPLDSATNIDILTRNGFNFNEIMTYLGEEEIDEPWAYERHMTKNYGKVEKEGSKE